MRRSLHRVLEVIAPRRLAMRRARHEKAAPPEEDDEA
jgi:hypothetical protein